jgi:hypothetical protein
MSKDLIKISPDLTIPGFHVEVENALTCKVASKDGRHEFLARIVHQTIKISGPMFSNTMDHVGAWSWFTKYTIDADDVITHVANSLRLMDVFSSDGFSAKIDDNWLVLSHSSKPEYLLRMSMTDVRRFASSTYPSVYTAVEYCGPAYDAEANVKWRRNGWAFSNRRYVVIDKDFQELAQELKTRVLNLGAPDPRIAQWVAEELEKELLPQGIIFTSLPEKGIVEFYHPVGLSGSLSFALFTVGYNLDTSSKYPNPHFPTDIEKEKVVLFTCHRPSHQELYARASKAKEPNEIIENIQEFLALALVYQEVCNAWKSDILIPKLNGNSLHLINTRLSGEKSIIMGITPKYPNWLLTIMGEEYSYPISNGPGGVDTDEITRNIVERAERYVQKFIQTHKITSKVVEVDL